MNARDDNRLTADDRAMIQARIAETVRDWTHEGPPTAGLLAREGYRSIGCDARSLRDSELAEIDGMVAYALGNLRLVPRYILVDQGAEAARAWYRGWDAANLTAPIPEP